ncbi:hypothetical protein DOY81_002096 [Sarcophaga bullata]|nr:hypothetical protein DOY81_002096 [Sarcophaga bullata]
MSACRVMSSSFIYSVKGRRAVCLAAWFTAATNITTTTTTTNTTANTATLLYKQRFIYHAASGTESQSY